jgi:hypothetical protein
MNNITIAIKNKTNLTLQLEKKYNIDYYKKPSLFSKLLLQDGKHPDIYFHKGFLSSEAVDLIEKSRIVIVTSNKVKEEIVAKVSGLDISKLHVIYPYLLEKQQYEKSIKKNFKKKFDIAKESKILFFRGTDLSQSGLAVLTDVISRMYKDNFTLVIESNLKQITPLKLQMERSELKFQYLLLSDYEDLAELFISSDIFILPTNQKYFSTDVLKAMYYRNAVFVMESNPASELIDVFSLIQSEEDRSVSFKVDSLLINKNELKKIQKENQKITDNYSLEKSFNKISEIIEKTFDI